MFSIQEHIKEHRIKLGESIQKRHKIYLDTNYWGLLCDVSLGIITDDISVQIYQTLLQLAKEKKIICPLSYRIYSELRKQKDIQRLNKTAKIMDLLSEDVMIIFEDERIYYELLYFFYEYIKDKDSAYDPNLFVWSKISFVLGTIIPEYSPMFSDQENEYIQKEFFEYMWEYSLSDMIQKLGVETNPQLAEAHQNTVNIINIDKVQYEYQLKNSKSVYMDEIAGCLDAYRHQIENSFNKFKTNMTNSSKELDINTYDIQPIINMLYNLFEYEKMGLYLPTFDISARAHATIRWNKTRKYKANDLDDIGHMYSALPYYDYFFTEKSFYSLITQEKYDKKYSCIVVNKPKEVLKIINTIK